MKRNYLTKGLSTVGRFLATTLFCVLAVAFVWQGAFFSNTAAMANPAVNLIASADAGDQVKDKVEEGAGAAKNFIRDTQDKVKQTARKNASKVDEATDNGSFVERKAKSDKATIEKRANEDAARTEKAVDNSKNAVQGVVDKIKDAFSN
ncbi:hypothetical protein [Tolypothrix sp. VBCCA 56010]|uniref:hypothetical protein n=1 Tax=Tolypothrix sp. VBCCA 56010 TaxID=3137731 RepID=UPI003D7D6ECA